MARIDDKHAIEDVILRALRRMDGFVRVDDHDVGLAWFEGRIDVGRIADDVTEEVNKWQR